MFSANETPLPGQGDDEEFPQDIIEEFVEHAKGLRRLFCEEDENGSPIPYIEFIGNKGNGENISGRHNDDQLDIKEHPASSYRDMQISPYLNTLCNKSSYLSEDIDDLRLVGIEKLLGYIPLKHLADVEWLKHEAEKDGLSWHVSNGYVSRTSEEGLVEGPPSFYKYDKVRLQRYLESEENKKILEKYKMPIDADFFVKYVSSNHIDQETMPDLYDLLALAFDDPREEYQRRRIDIASL